tara:strand:- start:750 stop:1094 length:345 start_codon:yes stop_codon:yes gene_type:complete
MKEVAYVLRESERAQYEKDIYTHRRIAINCLQSFLKEKEPDEWVAQFSVLSEFIGILYHFENILEEIRFQSTWDKKENYWVIEEILAMRLLVCVQSSLVCKDELSSYGMSLSLH